MVKDLQHTTRDALLRKLTRTTDEVEHMNKCEKTNEYTVENITMFFFLRSNCFASWDNVLNVADEVNLCSFVTCCF